MLNRAPEKMLFYEGLLLNKVLKAGKEDNEKCTKLQGMKLGLFVLICKMQ